MIRLLSVFALCLVLVAPAQAIGFGTVAPFGVGRPFANAAARQGFRQGIRQGARAQGFAVGAGVGFAPAFVAPRAVFAPRFVPRAVGFRSFGFGAPVCSPFGCGGVVTQDAFGNVIVLP